MYSKTVSKQVEQVRGSVWTDPKPEALQGTKKRRKGGDEHMAVVEEFCYAVKDKWPHALIQFEDFNTDRAFAILERLQDKVLCFNDDIQV